MKTGADVRGLALVSALWCRYCFGSTESSKQIAPNDPIWARVQAAATRARTDPLAFLEMSDIFGEAAQDGAYIAAFSNALASLWARGVRATLAEYLAV